MLVVLPNQDVGVNTLAERLASSNRLKSILQNTQKRSVDLFLPKFKLTAQLKLVSTLQQVLNQLPKTADVNTVLLLLLHYLSFLCSVMFH
jgi:hypothetical protein